MKTQNLITGKFLLLFVILILNSNQNSVKAQTFSCPYIIDNSSFSCPITVGWTITCNTPPAGCGVCATGSLNIAANTNVQIPGASCSSCLSGCTNCEITIRLLRINGTFITSPFSVNSLNTSGNDPNNTNGCCTTPGQLPTLNWYGNTTRMTCQ